MYLRHYQLQRKPFQITTDPAFMWLGEKHAEALATLKYGIQENKGFLLLTGDVGTGKTALIKLLLQQIDVSVLVATVPDPGMEAIDFFNFLADEFGMKRRFVSKGEFLIEFKRLLLAAHAAKRQVLLIVDEAQRLNAELLREAIDLARLELAGRRMLKVFFLGQLEFDRLLAREENRDLLAAVSAYYRLEPFTAEETRTYIGHRLAVAGRSAPLFTDEALAEIHRLTRGVPRLINILCGHALLYGFGADRATIGLDTVRECTRDLTVALELEEGAEEAAPPDPSPVAQAIAARRAAALPAGRGRRRRLLLVTAIALSALALAALGIALR